MANSVKAIVTNICMIEDIQNNILVLDRLVSTSPSISFLVGKIENAESIVVTVVHEVFEDTGLMIHNPQICRTMQFQTDNDEKYIVLMYKATQFSGTLSSSDEREVFWIKKSELTNYKLANDF